MKAENTKSSSKKLPKVFCSYGHTGESNWIRDLGFELTNNRDEAGIFVFGGGKDVDPGFYGEPCGSGTDSPTNRDKKEKEDFLYAQKLRKKGKNVKCVGVCRGGQLLCALSGGKVIQDVSNHFGNHYVTTFDKMELMVNSIHHQMMFPFNLKPEDYKLYAWSQVPYSSRYLNGHNKPMWLPDNFVEPEIIYFPKTESLAIQFHPEMMVHSRAESIVTTIKWLQDLFLNFYENENK